MNELQGYPPGESVWGNLLPEKQRVAIFVLKFLLTYVNADGFMVK